MTYSIAICSGKGGTGKSTTAINLSSAMKYFNRDVILLDNNLTSPNIGLYLGIDSVSISLNDALKRKNHATESVYEHSSGLKVIPASIALKDLNISPENLRDVMLDLKNNTEFIVLDNSGGLNSDVAHGIRNANEVLIVTNPDLVSVTGALRTIKFSENLKKPVRGVILSRVKNTRDELSLNEIEKILGKEIIGIVEEDDLIKDSLAKGDSVVNLHPDSKSSIEYKKIAARILDEKYEEEYIPKNSTFFNILKFFGIKK